MDNNNNKNLYAVTLYQICGTKTQSRYNRNRLYLLFFLPKRSILADFKACIYFSTHFKTRKNIKTVPIKHSARTVPQKRLL